MILVERSSPALNCHPERKLYANGLCRPCYEKQARKTRTFKPSSCHPKRRLFAKGKCQSCYMKDWFSAHPLTRRQVKRRVAYNARWARAHPDRVRATRDRANHRRVLRLYGMSEDQFDELILRQKMACAICGKKFEKRPSIDHDHATGKIRGLLCSCCNTGIGMFGDRVNLLLLAVAYLQKHSAQAGVIAQ